ncbi:alpha/beta hydrolase [Halomonas huangheensis]|uniref:Serine aminopeptidase S33 domain-containing protein n=1 Tax=Halomonas huangheensis TaxID=1178482 RepID=W1NA35_9GAMM|nr:alpha/beta fold hydrolase [Halomonas huangheensis]ERL52076.1 hypothetical protein BJB45_08925 [Halomonas huangheensis]
MSQRVIQSKSALSDEGEAGDQDDLPEGALNVAFSSKGTVCRGWHFAPTQQPAHSTVLMAHGLGGTIDGGLVDYARQLSRAGYRVVAFDYRYFGRSDGKPRQLLTVGDQLADWTAAITFTQRLDPSAPLVLWGTSFSSGHVASLAARREDIAAVIAMNPMLDGLSSVLAKLRESGWMPVLKLTLGAFEDYLRGLVGIAPKYVAIVGEPGDLAAMTAPDAEQGVTRFAADNFVNSMSARMLLTLGLYRPIRRAGRIRCPVLLQLCLRDSVTPVAAAYRTAARLGRRATVKTYDAGHFDIYQGELQEAFLHDQLIFLERALSHT